MKAISFSSRKIQPDTSLGFPPEVLPIFFEHCPAPLFVWDWKSGKLLGANLAAGKYLGYSGEDLEGMELSSLLPEGILDRLPSILRDEQKNGGISLRTTLRCKTGEWLPVEVRTSLIRNGDDTLRFMVVRDLSENFPLAVEEKILERPIFLPRIFEEQEMIFEISAEGFFTTVNSISLLKTGYSRQDLREEVHFIRILLPEDRERARRDFRSLLRGECLDAVEYTILRKDGVHMPIILSLTPITGEGEVRGVRGVGLDITEHRRIEQEMVVREKLNMLGELTGGVVHNFNNILSVILGYLEVLPTGNMDESGRRIVQNIRRAAMDGTDIVRRIQKFSTSKEFTEAEQSDLNDILREVLEDMKPRYESANPPVKVKALLQPVSPVLVIPFEMREVMSNIIINALDAMPGGGVLTVSTEEREGYVKLAVADTGIGMSRETRRRLFEPYFTTKGEKGTGIGMSVSRAIMDKFGGEIKVDTEQGRGTTVSVQLPCAKVTRMDATHPAVPECPTDTFSILVIDDEANICEILDEFLSREGHRVVTATGSKPGLEALQERTFDILITDLNMPGVSGWEIARQVRGASPKTCIIMLTGWGMRIEDINRNEQVVDYLLIKPIRFSELTGIIARAFTRK